MESEVESALSER